MKSPFCPHEEGSNNVLQNGVVVAGFEPVPPNCCIEPYAINNKGQLVGATGGTFHGFIWQEDPGGGGTVADPGTFGGSAGFAAGMNNEGQIVGLTRYSPDPFSSAYIERAMLLENGVLTARSRSLGIPQCGSVAGRHSRVLHRRIDVTTSDAPPLASGCPDLSGE